MENSFAEIAEDYDDMFPRDLVEDGRMLLPMLERNKVRTVLDCACGTGMHLQMLASRGYEVTGSDASDAMLERARDKVRRDGLGVRLVQSMWHELPQMIPERFDSVICIGNSLPLAGSDDDVEAAVTGMVAMLNEGGLLVVQNRNFDRMVHDKPEAVLNEADDGYVLFVFDYEEPTVIYKIFYLLTRGERQGDVSYSEFRMNLLTRSKFEAMLSRAGAGSVRFYGDSFLSNFSPTRSPRLIAVARA